MGKLQKSSFPSKGRKRNAVGPEWVTVGLEDELVVAWAAGRGCTSAPGALLLTEIVTSFMLRRCLNGGVEGLRCYVGSSMQGNELHEIYHHKRQKFFAKNVP